MLRDDCEKLCPACSHRELSEAESLAKKQGWLTNRLKQWNNRLTDIRGVHGDQRWNYREKVSLSARWGGNRWLFGLISKDELIPIHNCPVHSELVRNMVKLFSENLPSYDILPLVFLTVSGPQATLVIKADRNPESKWLNDVLKTELKQVGLEGLWINLNPSAGKRVYSSKGWSLLWGESSSLTENGFLHGPIAFQQLIPSLHDAALSTASDFFHLKPVDSVIDLYSGIGVSLRHWKKLGVKTIGVELNGEAASFAGKNVPGAICLRGRCSDRIPQLDEWISMQEPLSGRVFLYVNPPRTGLEQEICEWVVNKLKPVRIGYLSCSAGTLSRDLEFLTLSGYKVSRLIPYDFFPHTHHVEVLALIEL